MKEFLFIETIKTISNFHNIPNLRYTQGFVEKNSFGTSIWELHLRIWIVQCVKNCLSYQQVTEMVGEIIATSPSLWRENKAN